MIIRFSCVLLRSTVMLRMPEASRILSFLLSSFSPLPYSSFPPFSFSPFFLEPTRLFFSLSRLRPCLFSRSRSRYTAWPVPAPCAMPYPTARLIQENVRRFVLLHCGNFVRFRKNAITDRKFKVIFLFESFSKRVINLKLTYHTSVEYIS